MDVLDWKWKLEMDIQTVLISASNEIQIVYFHCGWVVSFEGVTSLYKTVDSCHFEAFNCSKNTKDKYNFLI